MKQIHFKLGIGIVQRVPFSVQQVEPKQKDDFTSWKLIKIFAVIAVIKVTVFLLFL
jgi:hypothetical protein